MAVTVEVVALLGPEGRGGAGAVLLDMVIELFEEVANPSDKQALVHGQRRTRSSTYCSEAEESRAHIACMN